MSVTGNRRKTACVTGGNGYIASALVKMLLQKGYAVRATVRNPDDEEKNSHLKGLQALGPLTILRADLDEEGSFDEAVAGGARVSVLASRKRGQLIPVAGCDYAFLVATPINFTTENPAKDLIEPAVRGTLNVMRSCVKAGTVKRAILTSSTTAVTIWPFEGDGRVLDEESWSDVDWLSSEKPCGWGYPVSKVLSEKAAWKFAEEHGISLVTIYPVVTVGAAPATKIHTSVPASLALLSGNEAELGSLKFLEKGCGGVPMVHVDDVCRAVLFVAEEATAGRYICCSLNTTVAELARFLPQKYPQYKVNTNISGDLLENPRPKVRFSSAKLVREGFQFKYKTLEEIYDDLVEYGKVIGILPN